MSHSNATENVKDAIIDFIGGSLGGAAQVYVGQPFDTIKVKMQTFPTLYRDMVHCFKKTFKSDGIKGLYAGTIPAVVANVAENSVLFAGYGFCQKIIMNAINVDKTEEMPLIGNASAGFLAAAGSSLTLCPTELIKCRLQAMREMETHYRRPHVKYGPYTLTRSILKSEGIGGLFNGLGATMVREMPGYFCFFGGYEGIRELLRKPGQSKDEIGLLRTMIAGACGGAIFWIVIFPADVIKSRMQIQTLKDSFLTVGNNIMKKEGFLALYNGLLPTVVRTIPATATLFVVYEYTKKTLNLRDNRVRT